MPICVIIPVFKQSGLAWEAIASFLAQDRAQAHRLVIVDDGCPFPHNLFGFASLASLHQNVAYVRRRNGGLSAARNTGLEFALEAFPESEAFFFLDADNRLSPSSLERFEAALRESDADWFFPDIEMFGVDDASFDFSGPYSAYLHVLQNICEAGSLVRRRVLDAGIRFDEAMKLGYEDWDFWLSAVARGFRGEHLAASGFQYRKRAESMVSASARIDPVIKHYLRGKHRWMSNPAVLTSLEHRVTPRYAIVDSREQRVVLCSDPCVDSKTITLESYADLMRRSIAAPHHATPGTFVVFMSHRLLSNLKNARICSWLFIEVERATTGDEAILFGSSSSEPSEKAVVAAISASRLVELCDRGGGATPPSLATSFREDDLLTPFLAEVFEEACPAGDAAADLRDFCRVVREVPAFPPRSARRRTHLGRTDLHKAPLLARHAFAEAGDAASDPPLPNKAWQRRGKWAFVVDADAVTPRLARVARALATSGYTIDLVVLGRPESALRDTLRTAFASIYAFTPDPRDRGVPDLALVTNVLSAYEAVLVGTTRALPGLALLRDRGVVTAMMDGHRSARGTGVSSLAQMVAFEHVIDLYICPQHWMRDEFVANGVPASKILSLSRPAGTAASDEDDVGAVAASWADAIEGVIRSRRIRTAWELGTTGGLPTASVAGGIDRSVT